MAALIAVHTLWLMDVKLFLRQKGRIFGMIMQPLAFFLLVGVGISATMHITGAPPGLDYIKYMFPGIIGMSIVFTSSSTAVSIIWERELGYLKEVLVAPVPRWAVAVGKALGGATIATIQVTILLVLAPIIGVRLTVWTVVATLLISFILGVGVTGFGVYIASRSKGIEGFQMAMNAVIFPAYFLSGGMYPLTTVPRWMALVMKCNPLTYALDAIRNVVYVGSGSEMLSQLRATGIVHWAFGFDLAIVVLVMIALLALGSLGFSRSE